MGQYVTFDVSQLKQFADKLEAAGKGDFKQELILWVDAIGNEFLNMVVDQVISRGATDTRNLLSSFMKGGAGNVWQSSDGGLTLEVGTDVEYAKWVNDGHKQQPGRFIPGSWNGDRFIYQPGAKTGMVLKAQWVEGKHYWEAAIRTMEAMMPNYIDAKLNQWLSTYFGV